LEQHLKLVEQAINGNDDAFVQLMQLYKVDLYKTALSFLKNKERSLEAVQEVTYRAYKNLHKVRQKQYFKTWLIRIMINYCQDELKKDQRIVKGDTMLEQRGESESYLSLEIEEALDKLDNRSREVVTLKYLQELSIKEIATVMERPEGTIKTWLHKALQQLRAIVKEEGGTRHE